MSENETTEEKREEKQQEYVQEIKMQIIKEELNDIETPQTRKKMQELQALDGWLYQLDLAIKEHDVAKKLLDDCINCRI